MNHACHSGSVVRWPHGVSWMLFVYQERSRDRLAEWTRALCFFCPVSIDSQCGWVGCGSKQSTNLPGESARNAQKWSVFRTTLKAHFQRGSHTWFTYVVHIRGSHTWFTYVVHIRGSHMWFTYVVHIRGSHTWFTYVVHIRGSHTWFKIEQQCLYPSMVGRTMFRTKPRGSKCLYYKKTTTIAWDCLWA